jgi:hypothetical protein
VSATAPVARPAFRAALAPLAAGLAVVGSGALGWLVWAGPGVAWGVLAGRLAGELLLPALGLGFAAGASGTPLVLLVPALALGGWLGDLGQPLFLQGATLLPNAATHAFLTGPVAGLGVGLALFSGGTRFARAGTLLAAALASAMAAIAIPLIDPSFHDPAVPVLAAAGLLALVLLLFALARAMPASARGLGARILGAWVLAVALLYGGATIAFRGRMVAPDATGLMGPADSTPFPDFAPEPAGSAP